MSSRRHPSGGPLSRGTSGRRTTHTGKQPSDRSRFATTGSKSAAGEPPATYSALVCARLQAALVDTLATQHCQATNVSIAVLQYRLLGARRYWYRSVRLEKNGKRWEAQCFEVKCRRSTRERLRASHWHELSRLTSEDVQLTSLGLFDTERAASRAYEAAFRARDAVHPLVNEGHGAELPQEWTTHFHVSVVSEVFARKSQRERLEIVYEQLLLAFSEEIAYEQSVAPMENLRGFSYVGDRVRALPQWRFLPFHLHVVVSAKTPAQWRAGPRQSGPAALLSETERLGLSHLTNDRALNVDASMLPASRGLAELVSVNQEDIQGRTKSVLPHFYHGLPDELKRMLAEEQTRTDLTQTSGAAGLTTTPTTAKLLKNTEASFLPKYLKRRREYTVAATRIQRLLRRNSPGKMVRYLLRRQRVALTIQRVFRGYEGRVYYRAYRHVMTCASILVQSVYRSHASRKRTRRMRWKMEAAALAIERVFRGFVERKFVRWMRQLQSRAIVLERVVRGFMGRRRATRIRVARHKKTVLVPAVLTMQRVWRGHRARKIAREKRRVWVHLRVLDPAALGIGRVLRGFLARRTASRYRQAWDAAIVIQKFWKSYRYRMKWMELMAWRRRSTLAGRIGALGRGYVARRFIKRERKKLHLLFVVQPAVVRIQRVFRGYVIRKGIEDLRDRMEAAITLQQMWRKRSQIRTICDRLRGFRLRLLNTNATKIQQFYKCCQARYLVKVMRMTQRARYGKAAVVIQSAWRSHCSRITLKEFRYCSRIERKASALTNCKEQRENIEFDLVDARADLRRLIRFKAKTLRRIKELKEMRLEWERRQPVVEKEISQLTEEDLDRGWGEAFTTEKHILRFSLELSVEDVLGRRDQVRECDSEIEDLRLELDDLERDLEECILDETVELEQYRSMEMQYAQIMFAEERERKIRLQRVRWRVRNVRTNVIHRLRIQDETLKQELSAQRPVQELGVLGFEKKRQLQLKMEEAIEKIVNDRAAQGEVMAAVARDEKVTKRFDEAIHKMGAITNQYSFEYRTPKHDMREQADSEMCDECGRITCDCHIIAAQEHPTQVTATGTDNLSMDRKVNASRNGRRANSSTNHGHPLRRKRNYEQE